MRLRSLLPHALIVLALAAPAAQATIMTFQTTLAGSNEVPPNASPGTGNATVSVDTDLHTLQVLLTFSGLLGTTTASHIHCCAAPGTNAGVATQLPTFAGFPIGVTSGTYAQLFDMSLASSWNPSFITAQGGTPLAAFNVLVTNMQAGLTYLNIHTSQFTGGEIRGQLTRVPEPGTLALLSFALVGAMVVARRPGWATHRPR